MGLRGRIVIVCRQGVGLGLEFVEHVVEVMSVEDEAGSLAHGLEAGTPHFVKGTAFDADVIHGFGARQAALHGESRVTEGLGMRVLHKRFTCGSKFNQSKMPAASGSEGDELPPRPLSLGVPIGGWGRDATSALG